MGSEEEEDRKAGEERKPPFLEEGWDGYGEEAVDGARET